jgi:hypothetical protein
MFLREAIIPLRMNIPGIVKFVVFQLPETTEANPGESDPKCTVIITEYLKNASLEAVIQWVRESGPVEGFGPTELSKCIFMIAVTMARWPGT